MEKDSAVRLRQFNDELKAHTRALQSMYRKEQLADGVLLHSTTLKFNAQSLAKCEKFLPIDIFMLWSSMESFLNNRCCRLENIGSYWTDKIANHSVNKTIFSRDRNPLAASIILFLEI